MKHIVPILIAIAVLSGGQAFAGEKHECAATAQECLDHMVTYMMTIGIIGVEGDKDEATSGIRITDFMEGTNAQAAGVVAGDILIKINGIALSDKEASKADTANRTPGQTATITVLRDGAEQTMDLTLIAVSDELIQEKVGHHMIDAHVKADLEKAKAKRKTKIKAKEKTKTKRKVKAKAKA
jgi:predicted metalloprotease with PDZ domain